MPFYLALDRVGTLGAERGLMCAFPQVGLSKAHSPQGAVKLSVHVATAAETHTPATQRATREGNVPLAIEA
jgi:hypothetical protein